VGDGNVNEVIITEVTLREYGQNVPASFLHVFTPQIRIEVALKLVGAGFRNLEVLSCVHPRIAPAMDEASLRKIAQGIGRLEGVNLITLVPNFSGYKTFLSCNLGPGGYRHSLGIFFSAVEAHNLMNLGRTTKETLDEYQTILRDASQRNIRVVAYVSAAFGYRPEPGSEVFKPDAEGLSSYIDMLFDLGAVTVTLSDLQGVAGEEETGRLLETVVKGRERKFVKRLGYHPHHVRGDQGIANSRIAYDLGIRRFDSSLGGTGGCVTGAPGNQPTEGLVEFFEKSGVRTGVHLEEVAKISRFVEREIYTKSSGSRLSINSVSNSCLCRK
jgi:hydroxymethylglutaryl-CoA lyase